MQRDYREMEQEVKELTTVDGFIAACLEIKDSMFFYDRDLVLSAYTASVELLTVSALFCAGLEGVAQLERVRNELEECVHDLLTDLAQTQLPLDIQYLAEHYTRGAGYAAELRMSVYGEMMTIYCQGIYETVDEDIDELLRRCHHLIYISREERLNHTLALVGAKMLRGAHLRPMWLHVSHPRIHIILSGLQTLMNNFRVAPYFTYPFEDAVTERQKRKKIGDNVVLDLGAFRNFRQSISGYTDLNVVLEQDEYDRALDDFISNDVFQDQEPDYKMINLVLGILEARLVNPEIEDDYIRQVLWMCHLWEVKEASDLALHLLSTLDSWDPLFHSTWQFLRGLDGKAVPAMRRFVKQNRDSHLLVVIADMLAQGSRGKRKWSLLTDIFENSPWNDMKPQLAMSIALYGGLEAQQYLEAVLINLPSEYGKYRPYLEKALDYAQGGQER